MRTQNLAPLAILLIGACQAGSAGSGDVPLETEDQKASYAIGIDIGNSLEVISDHVQVDQLIAGLTDVRDGRVMRLDDAELRTVMMEFNQKVQAEQQAKRTEDAEKNRTEGEAFMAANGAKDGVSTTESGLQYEVLRQGDGPKPDSDDRVVLHYKGTLLDGTEFDSTIGGTPATFAIGAVIPGFTEALLLMNVGSHMRVFIPGELAYGAAGSPPSIGPNATLVFEIEMLEIAE